MDAITRALRFVEDTEIPVASSQHRGETPVSVTAAFDTAKTQAAVVGADVISFVSGVTAERREDIVNASLLAQLVAKKKVPDQKRIYDWYNAYFDALTQVGWSMQQRSFAQYQEKATNFETHKAILAVATAALGSAPTALALVTSTIKALQSIDEDRPWITLFNRETQHAETAHFQIGLVDQDPSGQFFVSLMAFGLEAKSEVTQVLLFRARASEVTLRHLFGRVTISTSVLDKVREPIKAKLAGHANDYVSRLPDLF
ncbi:MAG TPA: hypothetical protein VK420_19200 [Longimicrobium sp.]|nr:hypothetical protein [Longimicrobium sp.]